MSQKLDQLFGDDEAVKCALAANLSYFHDDPGSLWWNFFAMAQGSYLLSGARFVQGGSQRLSSALARAVRTAGGEVVVRRVASAIALDPQGRTSAVTHTAKDGSDAQVAECTRVIGGAAPGALAQLMPEAAAAKLTAGHAGLTPSISLFALTLGPVETAARIRRHGLFHAAAARRHEASVRLRARRDIDGGRAR